MYIGEFKHIHNHIGSHIHQIDDTAKTVVPQWKLSLYFLEMDIKYCSWSNVLITKYISNIMEYCDLNHIPDVAAIV